MKLKVENGAIEIKGTSILEKINFEIIDGDHIALVGKNGAGKTTLLKAIIDPELFKKGFEDEEFKVTKLGNYKIGYLEQIKINEDLSLFEELISSYADLINLEKKIANLEADLTSDKNIMDYSNAIDYYQQLGGYTYKSDIETMIYKFGFKESDKFKKLSSFSGGEKMKVSFMKLLLSNPDLLILDEPTNHLDITAILWLEHMLKNYKKAFIVVSHDRMFLDNVVNIVYDIDHKEVIKYCGNYSKFVTLKKERYEKLLKDYEYQQAEIKRLTELYEKFRSKPTKAKMALSKLKQIERMQLIDKPRKNNTKYFKANTKNIIKSGKEVLNIHNLEFGYDNVLGKVNLEVNRGRKIGIIGQNGIGKSTLLKTLSKIINPISGKIDYGYNVKSAYFDQNLNFKTNGTVLEEFMNAYPELLNEEARSALGAFLFTSNEVDKNLSVLSGGEKVRLLLCEIFYGKPNLMFLDEPTNHLDIEGKEMLENILENYPETIVFVSHDRYFINKIADELLVFEDDRVCHYNCGYEEYLKIKKFLNIIKPTNKITKKEIVKIDNTNILKKLEKEINMISEQLKELNNSLYKEENYSDYQKMNELNKQINILTEQLNKKETEWYQLSN